jgi:hypothetical protein
MQAAASLRGGSPRLPGSPWMRLGVAAVNEWALPLTTAADAANALTVRERLLSFCAASGTIIVKGLIERDAGGEIAPTAREQDSPRSAPCYELAAMVAVLAIPVEGRRRGDDDEHPRLESTIPVLRPLALHGDRGRVLRLDPRRMRP